MPSVVLALDTSTTERAFARMKERAPYAIARALNRAAQSATTAMIRAISQDTGVKQADLRGSTKRNRRIWSSEARPDRPICTVFATTERIPLMDFGARGPEPSRGKGRGVRAGLRGGARTYRNAFIATMSSGHKGVFQRSPGARRLPVYELRGPSIYHVWKKHETIGMARAKEQAVKNLQHEFRWVLNQAPESAA